MLPVTLGKKGHGDVVVVFWWCAGAGVVAAVVVGLCWGWGPCSGGGHHWAGLMGVAVAGG